MTNTIEETTPTWTVPEPMRKIEYMVLDFFDDLGEFMIQAQKTGIKLTCAEISPFYVRDMLKVASCTGMWTGDFNCSKSASICNELLGANVGLGPSGISFSYRYYFMSLYDKLLELHDGPFPAQNPTDTL